MTNEPRTTCPICTKIPNTTHLNFLETGDEVPENYKPLSGWEGQSLSSGYKTFQVHCPECGTKYIVEIDVEPFLWDFDVTRLTGKTKDYEGFYS